MIREIIIHSAATRPSWMAELPLTSKVAEIRRWHLANGWKDIGYHWIIDRDGKVANGRDEMDTGAHTQGHNTGTIGICLIGGHGSNATDLFDSHYTPEQDAALRKLIADIKDRHQIKKISGHNDYAAKACPGFNVAQWLTGKPRSLASSRTMIGQAAAATGTAGATAVEAIAPLVSDTAQQVGQVSYMSDFLTILFVALTLAGIGLTVYARLDDWQKGRR